MPQVEVASATANALPQNQNGQSSSTQHATPASPGNSNIGVPRVDQQPKRILGLMPNYRAVSAGALPPPPTAKESFMVATDNSFDYSAFVFAGITSLLAEGDASHPQLGKGVAGFGRYYWRGFLDKADGNYMVDFVFPSFLHEDERYYAMGAGHGAYLHRAVYAATRVLITPNYHGKNTFNGADILGTGVAQAISLSYYPSETQTAGAFAQKFAWAVGRDSLTDVFREFWPDIDARVLHRHHHQQQ
ncbi:MAG: hypothetical protein ACLGXA_21380 [Acidobacteriota bacterium]